MSTSTSQFLCKTRFLKSKLFKNFTSLDFQNDYQKQIIQLFCLLQRIPEKHNLVLHLEELLESMSEDYKISAASNVKSTKQVSNFLHIIPVTSQTNGKCLRTYMFLDNGSRVSFPKKKLQLNLEQVENLLSLDIHGTQKKSPVRSTTVNVAQLKWRVSQYLQNKDHIFGAHSSPTCANYALNKVGEVPAASNTIEQSLYMNNVIRFQFPYNARRRFKAI